MKLVTLFLDFEWNPLVFLKVIKNASVVKIVPLIDENLISLSMELISEKGWLGKHEMDVLINTLKKQLEKQEEKFLSEMERILKERNVVYVIERREGNLKKVLIDLFSEKPDKVVIFIRRRNPLLKVVKPILRGIMKNHQKIEIVKV
ncbi:hypothetical protein [Thermotoga sp. KOL6]|uniref:hypothetical protein n=1 Tax=Thermotoga sp. KOL6 TaxID=126741 RepID=UPI000C772C73|nr:hypothetical protein [Thermotoga sp. KOL6]PLV59328.1 hypothetical protein AS005_06200 [Thermotoga sp. KOL6]